MCRRALVILFALGFASAAAAADAPVPSSKLDALGQRLFFETGLSASGRQSCATCHDPAHAFAPPNALAVQLGGSDGTTPGRRAVPTLRYLRAHPPFVERSFEHDDDGDGDGDNDAGPTGGLTWDGRADTFHDQALIPLFAPHEMANPNPQALAERIRHLPEAEAFRGIAGDDVFDHPDRVIASLAAALEAYEQAAPEFEPYTSKYDAYLRHQVALSTQERRGLAIFDDPERGNCAKCHPDTVSSRGAFPLFTDFGHETIAVPRNRTLPANGDPQHFDLGLCGPERTDLARHAEFCGAFKTPTLRNVATRKSYFHNGVMHTLRDAVAFYALRDVQPARWYPRGAYGEVRKYDDLPEAYIANLDVDVPFKPLPNGRPRLSERDIDDLVAFLKTLDDGYVLPGPNRHAAVTNPTDRNRMARSD